MTISTRQIARTTAIILMASAAQAAEHGGNAFPQLDSTSFPNQLAWLAITFVALYLIVSKSIVPNVAEVLSAREATIADAIAKAEAYKATAEATKGEFEAGGANTRAKAAELLAQVQAEAAKAQADAFAELDKTLAKQSEKASAALAKSVKAASADMESAAEQLAQVMVSKLLDTGSQAKNGKAA